MNEVSKKICLLGTFAVGKTSLIQRFTYNRFDEKYISTLGVKVSRKSVVVAQAEELVKLNMMIWDVDGRSEWSGVRSSYLRGSAGALLVCDMTRAHTIDELLDFAAVLRQISPQSHIVLVANKSDLADNHELTTERIQSCAENLNATYFMASAKTGDGVDDAFRHLGQLLISS